MISRLKARWLQNHSAPSFQINPADDTTWAASMPGCERVLHVVLAPAGGVRSAAAYAPGHKLVVDSDKALSPLAEKQICSAVAPLNPEVVVCHSFSPALASLARSLTAEGFRCVGVWHGATSQFYYGPERDAFQAMVTARREGVLRKMFAVKPGLHLASSAIEPEPFINFIPRLTPHPRGLGMKGAALVPAPINWAKNFHSNVLAAAADERLNSIWVTTECADHFEPRISRRIKLSVAPNRAEFFALLAKVDVVMNASLSECQPMTALEAMAHGVPCIYPATGLKTFDAHPYAHVVSCSGSESLERIAEVLTRVLDLSSSGELAPLLQDFATAWQRASESRLREVISA